MKLANTIQKSSASETKKSNNPQNTNRLEGGLTGLSGLGCVGVKLVKPVKLGGKGSN